MANTPHLAFGFPDLTAAQIASALGISPQAVRQRLRTSPATGLTIVSGMTADTWHQSALPEALCWQLTRAARDGGFNNVGELVGVSPWTPAVSLAECGTECLAEADKLMRALVPALRRRPLAMLKEESVRAGLDDYEKIFGQRISSRHFYTLIERTVRRDSGLGNYERLELYLPERPQRRPAGPAGAAPGFPAVMAAINESGQLETVRGDRVVQVDREETIWQKVCETRKALLEADQPRKRVDRELCNFLFTHAPSLAPTRGALKKKFLRRVAAWVAGKSFDQRAGNGADNGELAGQIEALPWFVPAARFFYLLTNRTLDSGSMPEAVMFTIDLPRLPVAWVDSQKKQLLKTLDLAELPACPKELRDEILRRRNNYQALVPESIANKIRVSKSIVQFSRAPHEWALNKLSAPGSQRRYFNPQTNQREIMRPGDFFGGDDATPGIAVCVPCADGITPTSARYGVLLGRFQWLVYSDCRTDKIIAWDYIVRPRGSYRAEDILNGMGMAMRSNGIPRQGWQLEGGTFNAKLVRAAISNLGVQHWRTYSPHQKPIEKVFDKIWTPLAVQFPHADMGRYRNENEANCKLYEACKAGHQDPRKYFPGLTRLLAAFQEEVQRHNARPIKSRDYGRWVPDEFFTSELKQSPLREFSADKEWVLAPYAVERKVQGMMVSCKVPLFEGFSVPYDFGADWLGMFNGCKVRIHFNPRLLKCTAKIVLLENFGEHKAGAILGDAELVSETAAHIRYILEWGDADQRAGFEARQKAAHFMRRETQGVGPAGRVEYSRSEQRDGLGQLGIIQRDSGAAAPKDDETTRRQNRLAQSLAGDEMPARKTRAERAPELETLRRQTEHLFV